MKLLLGDCVEEIKKLADNSVDAIVTDPPYGLSFMGKKWDYDVPSQEIWEECLRVLKPGGHLLSFAGTRTQHRMAVRIEDAGFEIRDMIAWVYGSGFPKSLNISKAIEATEKYGKSGTRTLRQIEQDGGGKEYELKGKNNGILGETRIYQRKEYTPTGKAKEWEGWGTALKPALEPITVARKPLSEKTVAENCLKWGVGGINIDDTRVPLNGDEPRIGNTDKSESVGYGVDSWQKSGTMPETGRFPSNLIHDGSDEVVSLFPETKSGKKIGAHDGFGRNGIYGKAGPVETYTWGDSGSASRFFYCAKASKSERNRGCEELEDKTLARSGGAQSAESSGEDEYLQEHIGLNRITKMKNNHPTVKPISLMEYLVKLVSREGAVVLDPFVGSGSTGVACKKLNRDFIGIEREAEYIEIAKARIGSVTFNNTMF